ncbi:MAG: methyltransferase [Gemmatimonadetes bacterium]|nr:methyltransferase [Gemmatimonadota bacterium]
MTELPFRILDDAAFARLRGLMDRHGFTDAGVRERVGLSTLFDFEPRLHARMDASLDDALDVLVRVFMDAADVREGDLDAHLEPSDRALLEDFGLLAPHPKHDGVWGGTVLLYPTSGPWLISDRGVPFGADPEAPPALRSDLVYPSMTGSAQTFLSYLPTTRGGSFLELCSGTGVAALVGAEAGAAEAWAVDITSRSTAFAAFNARLNGLDQVHPVEGDLWEPLSGRRFDVVVAHPPYVPAGEDALIYLDGGDDGERVTWGILGGLADHLAEGGIAQCTCAVSARAGRTAPQRVRDAFGPHGDELDLVFIRHRTLDPEQHFTRELRSDDPAAAARSAAILRRFEELGFEHVYYCTLVVRRHGEQRRGFTVELEPGPRTGWAEAAWVLDLRTAAARPDHFIAALLGARMRLSAHVRLEMNYRPDAEGGWQPERGRLRVEYPVRATVDMGWDDARLLAGFDGSHTLAERLQDLRGAGHVPASISPEAFARGFAGLVLSGVVEASTHPFPKKDDGPDPS